MSSSFAAGLQEVWTALEDQRARLLRDLQAVERDMEVIRRAVEIASRPLDAPRLGQGQPASPPAGHLLASPREANRPPDYTRVITALETLGPARDNAALPPKVDENRRPLEVLEIPRTSEALDELYESVREIALRAEPHCEPGGRRRLSSKGLVAGEPIGPSLIAVLRAAGRELSTSACVAAALRQRGLRLEGSQCTALVSRSSAILDRTTETPAPRAW